MKPISHKLIMETATVTFKARPDFRVVPEERFDMAVEIIKVMEEALDKINDDGFVADYSTALREAKETANQAIKRAKEIGERE